jgi:hypothetical protein
VTADAAPPAFEFTETYESGTLDVGNWLLTTDGSPARMINPTGGDPGGYLYGEVRTPIPTYATASTRYQPGVNDTGKRDSVFVGDWYARGIKHISADLQIFLAGNWTERSLTLHLMSWNDTTNEVAFDAFYTLPDMPDVPTGWNHYDFQVDARSTTVPPGWEFTRGLDGVGTDADWVIFMHQIDLVGFGFWKPHVGYLIRPWQIGIDNVHLTAQP